MGAAGARVDEWAPPDAATAHSYEAVAANSWPAWFFAEEARKNARAFADPSQEEAALIYNYDAKPGVSSMFVRALGARARGATPPAALSRRNLSHSRAAPRPTHPLFFFARSSPSPIAGANLLLPGFCVRARSTAQPRPCTQKQ